VRSAASWPLTGLVLNDGADRAQVDAALDRLMVRAGTTRASMLQHLERSQRIEVDVTNGGIVDAAQEIGRDTPLTTAVARMIHQHGSDVTRPGCDALPPLRKVN
jgi:2-dehydropantoate 2-reductase